MPKLTAAERHLRASIAAKRRHHPDDPAIKDLERDYRASRLEAYIRQQVAAAPALTAGQREELARILRPSPSTAPAMPTAEDFAAELRAETGFVPPFSAMHEDDDVDDSERGVA